MSSSTSPGAGAAFPIGPDNELRINCRERAGRYLSKTTDLVREAVGYSGVLGHEAQ